MLISHEHNDHVRGAAAVARRYGPRFYANSSTCIAAGLTGRLHTAAALEEFETGVPFRAGDLEITAFPLPHDAAGTVGFTVSDGRVKVGFATDLGSVTMEVIGGLSECDAVIIESNHDEAMLLAGPYPAMLKRRVHGPEGHLSNVDAAELISCVRHSRLKHLVLAHMSRTNNTPALGLESAKAALGRRCSDVAVSLGRQDRPCKVIRIG